MASFYQRIADTLAAGHPVTGAYSADDVTAHQQLHAKNIVRLKAETRVDELDILKSFPGADAAETVLEKIEGVGVSNKLLKRVTAWLKPGSRGIDLSNSFVRAQLDSLAAAGAITDIERDTIKGIAEETISHAEQEGLGNAKVGHIGKARVL